MKKLFLICLVATMALMQSCKDECKDVNCQNGGACLDGTCQCADGFSGTNCETRGIDAFIGAWTGNNVCPGENPDLINVVVAEVADSNTEVSVDVDGLMLTATVVGGVMTIVENTVEFPGTEITTSGEGEIDSDGALVLEVVTDNNGVTTTCIFTGI